MGLSGHRGGWAAFHLPTRPSSCACRLGARAGSLAAWAEFASSINVGFGPTHVDLFAHRSCGVVEAINNNAPSLMSSLPPAPSSLAPSPGRGQGMTGPGQGRWRMPSHGQGYCNSRVPHPMPSVSRILSPQHAAAEPPQPSHGRTPPGDGPSGRHDQRGALGVALARRRLSAERRPAPLNRSRATDPVLRPRGSLSEAASTLARGALRLGHSAWSWPAAISRAAAAFLSALYCHLLGGSKPSPLGDGFSILRSSRQPLHELKFRCRSSFATKPVVCGPWDLTAEVVSSGRIPVEPRQADNREEPGALQPASGGKLSAELRSEQDLSPLHRSPRL